MPSRDLNLTESAVALPAPSEAALADARAHSAVRGPRHLPTVLAAGALWLLIIGNGAFIVWMWLHGGGISGVRGRAEGFISLGRITGLAAVYLALLQVLLLSRLAPIERVTGFDRLTSWHRWNGKLCISLVLAHVLLITAGYSLAERISFGHEFTRFLSSYPGMVSATIATALMVAVLVSSVVIVRRRLRYESWYFVHFTIYAAIALGYLHQIPTGNEFAAHPLQADYWIALYAVVLALLLVYRVAMPMVNARRHRLRVAAVRPEARGVSSIEVTGEQLERLGVQPGQFMLWRFAGKGRWWQSHPFSLSAVPDGSHLRITVKGIGDFTEALPQVRPGTRVFAEGPFGVFTSQAAVGRRVALIAGGIGITPLRALFEEMADAGMEVTLIHRVISRKEAVFEDELREIAERTGAAYHLLAGDHRTLKGRAMLTPERLAELVPRIERRDVYVCGPAGMMDATIAALRALGVEQDRIHSERFALAG